MTKDMDLELFEKLIDNVTVIKGFLEICSERNNYHLIQARKELEILIENINKLRPDEK